MRKRKPALDKESNLKIDKDCFVDQDWIRDYVRMVIATCLLKGIKVMRIQTSRTRKGFHFYIEVDPPVEAELANRLQFLLGDDCARVDRNRARIRSGLRRWNKLFEEAGTKLRTVYQHVRVLPPSIHLSL